MRFKVMMVTFMLLCQVAVSAEQRAFKLIYKDYGALDMATRPLSLGVSGQRSDVPGDVAGIFGSIALLTYKDTLRVEAGCNWIYDRVDERVEVSMLTGISYMITDRLALGVWAAPFYNLYGKHPDDPWGISLGYTFGVGGN